jgi:hypothetical protein
VISLAEIAVDGTKARGECSLSTAGLPLLSALLQKCQ